MKKRLLWWIIIPMYIIVLGCEDSSEGDEENESIAITGDLRSAPQLFSLTDGIFGMSTYDLKFFFTMELNPPYGAYAVGLNSAVGVQAAVDLAHDFDSASLPDTGYSYDGDSTYVIGDSWYDLSTYGQDGLHSIRSVDSMVYFIRTADYEWVKFEVEVGFPDSFKVNYAIANTDNEFDDPISATINYSMEEESYFDFTTEAAITPEEWHIGFADLIEYSPELAVMTYPPSFVVNYEAEVRVAIVEGFEYEDLTSVPSDTTWLSSGEELRELGWNGSQAVLVYAPEIYNDHKMHIPNPDWIYIIDSSNGFYKLKFEEDSYSSSDDGQFIWFKYESL